MNFFYCGHSQKFAHFINNFAYATGALKANGFPFPLPIRIVVVFLLAQHKMDP
jgi:hypothetical protein